MSVKTGPQVISVPSFSKVRFMAETDFSLMLCSTDKKTGEIVKERFFAVSQDKQSIVRTKQDEADLYVSVPEGVHWSFEVENNSPFERVDSIPFEVPEALKKPETLEAKMRRFLAGMVAERYGADSDQMETFEESMDFDIDDPEMPLSRYEIPEATPDFVDESAPADKSAAKPAESSSSASSEAPKADPEASDS